MSMPFLSPSFCSVLDLDAQHADLYESTFHPDLPGLAFLGLWEQTGPYFPPLELQARWITYVWSEIRPLPSRDLLKELLKADSIETPNRLHDHTHLNESPAFDARQTGRRRE